MGDIGPGVHFFDMCVQNIKFFVRRKECEPWTDVAFKEYGLVLPILQCAPL